MELGWGHHHHSEAGARSTKQETARTRKPFPLFHALQQRPSSSSTILLGPACLPSSFPPSPLVLELVPLFISSTSNHLPTSVHLSTRPFFDFEKQSVKMGYTKTDELAINTIRVLAVSHSILKQSKAFLPRHTATASFAPPSPLPPPPLTACFTTENLPQPRLNMINCAHKSSV